MNALVIDNGSRYIARLSGWLDRLSVSHEVACFSAFPDDLSRYGLVLLSGAARSPLAFSENDYAREIAFVRDTSVPTLGICFGYEVIVRAFGGSLIELPEKHRGETVVEGLVDHPIIGRGERESAYEAHGWVANGVPAPLIELARSETGPAIVAHPSRKIAGFQFHPEARTEEVDGDMLGVRAIRWLLS
jgi:GMP synthase (glutamine-hydrolysing)